MIVPASDIDIAQEHWEMVEEILSRCLPDREVWAYGSRVSGRSWRYSDLDLVVVGEPPVGGFTMCNARDAFTLSRLPYIVDLKDWNHIPEHWREEIMRCYAVIHSPSEGTTVKTTSVNEARKLRGIGWEGDLDEIRSSRPPGS